jgi:hypothetical protein
VAAPLSQQLIWKERELAGERALRQGWEAECRRVLEQNRVLRATVKVLLERMEKQKQQAV